MWICPLIEALLGPLETGREILILLKDFGVAEFFLVAGGRWKRRHREMLPSQSQIYSILIGRYSFYADTQIKLENIKL